MPEWAQSPQALGLKTLHLVISLKGKEEQMAFSVLTAPWRAA